jgi:hypothetical protein
MFSHRLICVLLAFSLLAMLFAPMLPIGSVEATPIIITTNVPTSQGGQGERITASTLFFNNYTGDWNFLRGLAPNYTGINFQLPWPNATGITVLSDKLWINDIQQIDIYSIVLYLMSTGGMTEDQAFTWMCNHMGIAGSYTFDVQRYWTLSPIIILDRDTMPNSTVLLNEWKTLVPDYLNNGTFNRSAFPSYLLDFRMNGSAFLDLKSLHATNISVCSYGWLNCSREVTWTQDKSFNWLYYSSDRKYQTTLTLTNPMGYCNWYSVKWYVGYPANCTIDPTTLSVQDLNNAMRMTLGVNYDTSGAGVNMDFASLNAKESRAFTFTVYAYNASQGLGIAIAYTSNYSKSSYNGVDYFKSVPAWTNGYGRTYQGQMQLKLDLTDGYQRYIDPSSVVVYDNMAGRYLSPWEYSIASGLIFVDFVQVNVGSVQSFSVYFHLDLTSKSNNTLSLWDNIPGSGIPIWAVLLAVGFILGCIILLGPKKETWKRYRVVAALLLAVMACITFLIYYFHNVGAV